MVARVAVFEGVNADAARETMDQAEAVIRPLVEGLTGYRGRLDLLSDDGRMLSLTLFDSTGQARAAEPTFDEEMPRQLGELFREWEGTRVSVGLYEVLSDERP